MKLICGMLPSLFVLCSLAPEDAFAERFTTYIHTDPFGTIVTETFPRAYSWEGVIYKYEVETERDFQSGQNYSPFGEEARVTASEKLSFTGKPLDNTGMIYSGARYYIPNAARFTGIDPVGFVESNPMSFNRYLYANNNPYKYVDPDGEFINFAVKFAFDVGVNVALNYVTTGELGVASAFQESATGILNPVKGINNAGKLAKALIKARSIQSSPVAKRSADGRLRNANGTFAYDGGSKRVPNPTHGNTNTPDTTATLYGKFDADGNFLKWGKSQDPQTRYSSKELNGGFIKEYRTGPTDQILARERRLVERFPGPENKEPWAGSRRPQ